MQRQEARNRARSFSRLTDVQAALPAKEKRCSALLRGLASSRRGSSTRPVHSLISGFCFLAARLHTSDVGRPRTQPSSNLLREPGAASNPREPLLSLFTFRSLLVPIWSLIYSDSGPVQRPTYSNPVRESSYAAPGCCCELLYLGMTDADHILETHSRCTPLSLSHAKMYP